MKILFVSHKWQAKTGESCLKALKLLGHEAQIAWAQVWPISTSAKIYHKLKRSRIIGSFLTGAEISFLNSLIVHKAIKFKPDLVIINAGGEVSPDTLKEIKKKTGAKLVCWAGDDPSVYNMGPHYKLGVSYYDHYFLGDPSWYTPMFRALGVKNCSILQYGVDTEIYNPQNLSVSDLKKFSSDLCHLGSLHKERIELLINLVDFDLSIWGATLTKSFKRFSNIPTPLIPKIRSGIVPADVSNKIYNASKICLNIQHSQMASAHSSKTFEIAASGAFLLTSFHDPEHKCFNEDEIISFKNEMELRSLIEYYLKKDNERREIASRAYKRVIACHLYTHRLKQLIEECAR